MKKLNRKSLAFFGVLMSCTLVSGCGCGKKTAPDEKSTKVMQITITPEATPTPAPDQVSAKAVAQNGKYTMVNLFLADKKEAGTGKKAPEGETGKTEETDTEGTEDGSEE